MIQRHIQLTREVRFQIPGGNDPLSPVVNSWSGWPKTLAIAPFVTIQCTLRGPVADPVGYVSDVKHIDRMVREAALALLVQAARDDTDLLTLAQQIFTALQGQFPTTPEVRRIRLCPTPYQSLTVCSEAPDMITLTHQFEFSAAHRLHCADLSDEENLTLFGKCNSPNGHGHNYVVDISVRRSPDTAFDLEHFESTVCQHAIDDLDHKHLNVDVPEFRELNPTVENIALVIFEKLANQVPELERVRVYETGKTWAEVTAGDVGQTAI